MNRESKERIDRLESQRSLSLEEYALLIRERDKEAAAYLAAKAIVPGGWFTEPISISAV